MAKAQLYVNDELVDLNPSTVIALTFQVNDIAELKDIQTNYSNAFKVPKTDNNIRLFGYANEIQSNNRTPYKALDCKFSSEGVEIVNYGTLFIKSYDDGFDLQIVSGNSYLFNTIGEKKLKDLNYLYQELSYFIWSFSEMVAVYGSETSPTFFIHDNGKLWHNDVIVDIKNQYPQVFFKDIITAICSEAGYKAVGSLFDEEFNDGSLFPTILVPFTNADIETVQGNGFYDVKAYKVLNQLLPSTFDSMFFASSQPTLPFLFTDDNVLGNDASGSWTGGYIYTSQINGELNINISVPIFFSGIRPKFYLTVKKNGVSVIAGQSTESNAPIQLNQTISIAIGDVLTLEYNFSSAFDGVNYLGSSTFNLVSAKPRIFISEIKKDQFNEVWDFGSNAPDILQKDFIKLFCNLFCLTVVTNSLLRTVTFIPFNEIVNNKSVALDWSEYVTEKRTNPKVTFHPTTYAQENYLKYKHDDNVDDAIGNDSLFISDKYLATSKDIITLPVAASEQKYRLYNLLIGEVRRYIDGERVQTEPRLLIGQRGMLTSDYITAHGQLNFTEDGTANSSFTSQLNKAMFTRDDTSVSLSFDYIRRTYYNGFENMLNNYQQINVMMLIPSIEIQKLNQSIPIYIAQFAQYYYVKRISNWREGVASEVELVRI